MATINDDELYLIARRVLLDALDALGEHRDAIVLVGAQAVYLRVGDARSPDQKGNLKGLGYVR